MKHLLLVLFCLIAGLGAGAQGTSFATADTMGILVAKPGSLSAGVPNRYYRIVLPEDGTVKIVRSLTNSGAGGGTIRTYLYSRTQLQLATKDVYLYGGTSSTDTFNVYGRAKDTCYIRLNNIDNQPFGYSLYFDETDRSPVNESGPNDTRTQAQLITDADTVKGHIAYYSDNGLIDTSDYYKAVLPADGTIRLFVSGTNYSGSVNWAPLIYVYDKAGNLLSLLNGAGTGNGNDGLRLRNEYYLGYRQTIRDTMYVYGRAADTVYFRVSNYYTGNIAYPSAYTLRYDLIHQSPKNEVEPNNTFAQAQLITASDTVKGHIAYYSAGSVIDTNDFYKAVLPADGTIRLFVSGTNYNGYTTNNWAPLVYVYDKSRNLLSILNNAGNAVAGDGLRIRNEYYLNFLSTIRDTMNIYGRAADTVYFKVSNYYTGAIAYPSAYTLRYELTDQSPVNETEPNNTMAQAQLITASDTVKGHIAYYSAGSVIDTNDFYKAVMPADGTIRLYVSGTNFNGYTVNNWAPQVSVFDKAGNQLLILNNTGNGSGQDGLRLRNEYYLPFRSSLSDTMNVYGRAADTVYFRVRNYYTGAIAYPSSYTLRYEVIHQTAVNETEPNNTFAQAQLITPADTVKGHIAYVSNNGVIDTSDYYKTVLAADGTIRLYVSGTNYNGYNGNNWAPLIYVYDKLHNLLTIVNSAGSSASADGLRIRNEYYLNFLATTKDTMNVYGRSADTVYFRVANYYTGNIAYPSYYTLRYELIHQSPKNETEPNNTFAQAQLITPSDTVKGHICYFSAGNVIDTNDFYRTVLPSDGTIRLHVSGTNYNGYTGNNWAPLIYVYDRQRNLMSIVNAGGANSGTDGLRVGNQYYLNFLASLGDTMHVYGRAADTVYFRVSNYYTGTTAYPSAYTLRYEMVDQSPLNEAGPNETIAQAQPVSERDTIRGHICYFSAGNVIDTNDYYRIVKPANGSIKLYMKARNQNGYAGNNWAPVIYAYDKQLNPLTVTTANGSSSASGQRMRNEYYLNFRSDITDTLSINCVAGDTVYVRVMNYYTGAIAYPSSYTLRYEYYGVAKAAFDYTRTGNEFGFTNSSRFASSYLWLMGNGNTYTSYYPPVINYVPGHYDVKLVAMSAQCSYRDTALQSFDVAGIEYYTPKSAGAGGDAHLQVYGGALDTGTKVTLRQGAVLITPREKYTNSKRNHLTAVMDLHFASPGLYDVILEVPGQQPVTYTNGFRIDAFRYPTAWSQVVGPSRWLANVDNQFKLTVGNNGNVTASGVVVAMVWPKTVTVKWLNRDEQPSYTGIDSLVANNKVYTLARSAYRLTHDSLNTTTPIDSFEGKPFDGYIRYLLVRHVPAGATIDIPFTARASAPNLQRFYTFTHRPNIFGSCPNGNYEDMMNDMGSELIDAADLVADKTKIPVFQAFTKTAKIGQKHMASAASYAGREFWAWWDGYEIDHNASQADWIRETEANNEFALQTFQQELAGFVLNAGVAKAGALNNRIEVYNKILANNPNLSPKSFDKVIDIINTSGKGLGNINYDRLKLLKSLFDHTKNAADLSEKLLKLQQLAADCPELQQQLDELKKILGGELDHNGLNLLNTNTVNSMDPNDIYGPSGVTASRYINNTQRQPFLITFENVDSATADAQVVIIKDTIDKTKFDIASVVLNDVVVGSQIVQVPKGRNQFMVQHTLDSIPGVLLRISASTDTARGIITWQFSAIDAATGNRPQLRGFLPPNVRKPEGTGSVAYTIEPFHSLADGTTLSSRASIFFDGNAPIATSTWTNRIDVLPPSSQVLSASLEADTIVHLNMTGTDNTSGIRKYNIYYATNNGPWKILGATFTDSLTMVGQHDSTYRFYSQAVDWVENTETKSPVAEAVITLPSGVNTVKRQGGMLSVFPNPADDRVTVTFELRSVQEVQVGLYSVTGQKVQDLYAGKAPGKMSVAAGLGKIPAGVYTIQLTGAAGARLTQKLIVTH